MTHSLEHTSRLVSLNDQPTVVPSEQKPQEDQRIEVELPVMGDYIDSWNMLGVQISSEGSNRFGVGKLPLGWTVRDMLSHNVDQKRFRIIDDQGFPRAGVFVKTTMWDQTTKVHFFSNEEARELVEEEQKESRLEGQFKSLLQNYYNTLRSCAGYGAEAQKEVDRVWGELRHFVAKHPRFESQAPMRDTAIVTSDKALLNRLLDQTPDHGSTIEGKKEALETFRLFKRTQ